MISGTYQVLSKYLLNEKMGPNHKVIRNPDSSPSAAFISASMFVAPHCLLSPEAGISASQWLTATPELLSLTSGFSHLVRLT